MPVRRTMRRNVIVSQGGNTGPGGTYLRDQRVSEEVASIIPAALIEVASEPGKPDPLPAAADVKPVERQSIPPPSTPVPSEKMAPPGSIATLRRWSSSKMIRLAEQEGIEGVGAMDKNGIRSLLIAHFGLK